MKKGIKLLAFLVLFTAVAVGVTYGLIQYTLREPAAESITAEAGIDLRGFYDENDLLFTEVTETIGEATLTYPQIDGLKNAEAEAAVNAALTKGAEELKAYFAPMGSPMNYMTYHVYASFANVLSVELFAGNENYDYHSLALNFDLRDGSLLHLEDLFGTQADLQAMVRRAFYEALTRGNLQDTYWESVSYPDENELYRTVKTYLAAEDKGFSFTPKEIYLHSGEWNATVSMVDYAADITVYHKFLTEESLYERDDIGMKNIFTCTVMPDGYAVRKFGFPTDNFWFDLAVSEDYEDERIPAETHKQVAEFRKEVLDARMADVEAMTETARANPDRAYILLDAPYVSLYTQGDYIDGSWQVVPSDGVSLSETYVLYELPMTLFETKYRDALVKLYRDESYALFYVGFDDEAAADGVTVTRRQEERLYHLWDGTELTLETLFVSGYDYDAAIRAQAKYDLMSYYNHTYEEAELLAQSVAYALEGTGVRIQVPGWEDEQYMWMSLNDFGRANLAIFN